MTTETVAPIDPSTTALLIMDYQNGVMPIASDPAALLTRAGQAIGLMRT